MQDEIKPALNALQEAFKNNERKSWSRYNAMKSPYYPIMESSITETCVDSN
jgi:hypothetical protein